jgi:hypothetical protein
MDCIVSAPGHLRFYFPPVDWEGVYDAFAVSRSRGGEAGPYEPLMSPWWRPASFSIPFQNGYNVVNKQLQLLLDGRVDVVVTLTGTDAASIVADLSAALPGLLVVEWPGGDAPIVFHGGSVGLGASLRVDGDAAPLLGLVAGEERYGLDAWRRLQAGQLSYDFTDPRGLETDFYQVRLFKTLSPSSCVKYSPVPGALRGGIGAEHLIEGYCQLFDMTGRPVENALVSLYASQRAYPPDGAGGIFPASVDVKTDRMGRARAQVVRGARLTLSISGTNLAREIMVPTEGQEFDLLDPSISVDADAYKVQVPNIIVGERRSL